MDLEKEISDSLALAFKETIDFEILIDILINAGWIRVETNYDSSEERIDITTWVNENITGDYREHNGTWVFESAADATMVALKWSGND